MKGIERHYNICSGQDDAAHITDVQYYLLKALRQLVENSNPCVYILFWLLKTNLLCCIHMIKVSTFLSQTSHTRKLEQTCYNQGPTTECSKYARSVSDGFLYTLEACLVNLELFLKTIYLFGCLRGTLVVKKALGGFFFSFESVSYPYGSGRKFEDMKYVLTF